MAINANGLGLALLAVPMIALSNFMRSPYGRGALAGTGGALGTAAVTYYGNELYQSGGNTTQANSNTMEMISKVGEVVSQKAVDIAETTARGAGTAVGGLVKAGLTHVVEPAVSSAGSQIVDGTIETTVKVTGAFFDTIVEKVKEKLPSMPDLPPIPTREKIQETLHDTVWGDAPANTVGLAETVIKSVSTKSNQVVSWTKSLESPISGTTFVLSAIAISAAVAAVYVHLHWPDPSSQKSANKKQD